MITGVWVLVLWFGMNSASGIDHIAGFSSKNECEAAFLRIKDQSRLMQHSCVKMGAKN